MNEQINLEGLEQLRQKIEFLKNGGSIPKLKSGSDIHIKKSKKGTFTAAATKHGQGVQEFANTVLKNKDNYSPAMVKKANFAKNASKWH